MSSPISPYILNCNGSLLDLTSPKVMGIVNLSQDSFYQGSTVSGKEPTLDRVKKMIDEGVDILDFGAASSRPGSIPISPFDELELLRPVLEAVRKEFPKIIISVDSYHKEVFQALEDLEINIANDISGFQENQHLIEYLGDQNLAYILMHKKGSTENMQDSPSYNNVSLDVLNFMKTKLHHLKSKGIVDVIIDPGFGFGKNMEHNYSLLNKLSVFNILEQPILVGLSRKSMIYKTLKIKPENALNGTTALHMIALRNNAKILRVHDVRAAKECISLYLQLNS